MRELLAAATPHLDVPFGFWVGFIGVVVALLVLDMVFFHRRPHEVRTREAVAWTIFWVSLALGFNAWIAWEFGARPATDFFTAYVLEESLSIDNLFVFLILFEYFKVPPPLQHRVLFFGILGAIVFRLSFVLAGAELLERFHWMNWVFGGFLVVTAAKLLFTGESEPHPDRNPVLRFFQRFVPFTTAYHGTSLTVVEPVTVPAAQASSAAGAAASPARTMRRKATMLLVVVAIVEATDIAFAVDSVPAVLAVTSDRFIAFTSNVAAVLGLRSIYFLLARFMGAFRYLKPALAFVLGFIGVKMFGLFELSSEWSLAVIGSILALAVIVSILHPAPRGEGADGGGETKP